MIEPLIYAQKAKLKAASLDEVYYDKNPDQGLDKVATLADQICKEYTKF